MQAVSERKSRTVALPRVGVLSGRSLKLFKQGLRLHGAGRIADAVQAFEGVVAASPLHSEASRNLAILLGQTERLADAVTAWERVLRLQPGDPASYAGLGRSLMSAGRLGHAIFVLSTGCQAHPGDADLLALNASALLKAGRPEPAVGALFLLLDLRPESADAHRELSRAFDSMGKLDRALESCLDALRIAPDHVNLTDLSQLLIKMGHYSQALSASEQVLYLKPDSFEAANNRAVALESLGRFDEAVAAWRHVVAASPDNPIARHNLAAALLSLGQLTSEAWEFYEWRFRLKSTTSWMFDRPRWKGEDIAGRTILLHAEQGMGDTLQFVRYAEMVAARGARVVLAVQPDLVRLLRSTPGVHQVVAVGTDLPAHDVICPLLSLPRAFGTTVETIPGGPPYIAPDPQLVSAWQLPPTAGLRVGLAWAGGAQFVDDHRRSMALADFAPLGGMEGVEFHSLQKPEPFRLAEAPPPGLTLIDRMAAVEDFADTAGLIENFDLVIAVDTSVAHLAAAMGKPVWLLSRHRGCWRWLWDRSDSPWYPTMRIYRQAGPQGWGTVIEAIRDDLRALTAEPRKPSAAPSPASCASAHGAPRPSGAPPRPCKACGTPAASLGNVDFNKCCEDRRRAALPLSGRRVAYHRCPACALVFTGDFDAWDRDEFRRHIYNEGYADADPDYAGDRPAASSALIGRLFGGACRGMDVLDYGGGDGALAALLARDHGMVADVYDPFNPACDVPPSRTYPLVTCFEVLEHTPDPRATIREIAGLVTADGVIVFSTLLQPADFERQGLSWWYVAPRNGHVTIYSAQALRALWEEAGFALTSHGDNLHLAVRTTPVLAPTDAEAPTPTRSSQAACS